MTEEVQRLLEFLKTSIQVKQLMIQTAYRMVSFYFNYTKDRIYCVRWDSKGERLVSASLDNTVKIIDFISGKICYAGTTTDSSK